MDNVMQMAIGQQGIIKGYAPGSGLYRKHLLALGLTPGTTVVVSRVAPLGDPVELKVRGCAISLRKEEAAVIYIEGLN